MQTAPIRATNNVPRNSRRRVRRQVRWRPKPGTIIVALAIAAICFGIMLVTFTGIWPPKENPPSPAQMLKSTSQYAAELKIDGNGPAKKDGGSGQITIPLKATNNVKIPPKPTGTVDPNVTPQPEPVKVMAATVKVLCYSGTGSGRSFAGTAYGGFSDQKGLAPGSTTNFDVIATGISACDEYEAVADIVTTDRDINTGQGNATAVATAANQGPATVIPLATSTTIGTP